MPGYVRGLLVPGGNIRSVRGLAYNDSLFNWPYQLRDGPSSARSSKKFSYKCVSPYSPIGVAGKTRTESCYRLDTPRQIVNALIRTFVALFICESITCFDQSGFTSNVQWQCEFAE